MCSLSLAATPPRRAVFALREKATVDAGGLPVVVADVIVGVFIGTFLAKIAEMIFDRWFRRRLEAHLNAVEEQMAKAKELSLQRKQE